jgi:hypothetical protein
MISPRLVLVLALGALLVSANAHGQTRRALLIGINDYETEDFPDLRGSVNDVEAMHDILVGKFGFAEKNVTVLTDREATRKKIFAALDALIRESAPDDMVYVHYSGHGSQVKDLNGDEEDGMDETILPQDARTDDVPDITDDEIGEFLRSLRTHNVIIVLDSCHSGTATRGDIVTRSVPPDTRLELYARPDDKLATRSIVPADMPDQSILMSAASAQQSALDGPIQGKYRGFFSYALGEALQAVPENATPRQIHEEVSRDLLALSKQFGGITLPDPQFEANAELLGEPLFRGESSPRDKSAAEALAQMTNPSSGLVITARMIGAGPEQVMHIRQPGDERNARNSIVLEIEVDSASYLTVVDVDSQGGVNLLFPNSYMNDGFLPEGRVQANSPVRIPDSLQSGNRAGFFWDYSPPAGVDTIQVFASTDLATANKIRSRIASLDTTTTRGVEQAPDYAAELADLHRQLLPDTQTRGVRVVRDQPTAAQAPDEAADWGSVTLNIRVEE